MGLTAVHLRAALARLIWCALFPENGIAGLPEGWFYGRHDERCTVQVKNQAQPSLVRAAECLGNLFTGRIADFSEWIHTRTVSWNHPFDLAVREADLETLGHFAERESSQPPHREPHLAGYHSSVVLRVGEQADPVAFPDVSLDLAEFFR
jgi:hypothetical protein